MQLFNTKVVPSSEDALWSLPHDLPSFTAKEILIVSQPYRKDGEEEQTLLKMVAACKLGTEQLAIVQLAEDQRLPFAHLTSLGIPKMVLLLGIAPTQLGIHALLRLNAPNMFMGYTIIPSLALGQIASNPEVKKELWQQGLKPGFGL